MDAAPSSQPAAHDEWRRRVAVAALAIGFAAVAVWAAVVHSGVPDEVAVHVPAGVLWLETGRFAGGVGNPPLGQLWVAWPALFSGEYVPFEAEGLLGPRLAVVTIALVGVLLLARLARAVAGADAAVAAVFFLATSPTFAAHASLATLDVPIAVATLAAVVAGRRAARDPGFASFAWLGLALGVACAIKVQGLALIPLVALQLALDRDAAWRRDGAARRASAIGAVAALAVAFGVVHASYGFGPLLAGELVPEAFVRATRTKLQHGTALGHQAYLLGAYSTSGWWSYFPIALAVKTPLVTLVAFAVGVAALVRSRSVALAAGLPLALFLGLGLVSSVNIGIRHLLPMLPFAWLVAGLGLLRIARASRVLAVALVAVQLGEAFWNAPHGLAYFNVFGGGRDGGHRVLLDSNYDWGQHDGALREYLAATPGEVAIDPDPLAPRAGRIVVGASALHGLLGPGADAYRWLREREPVRRIESTWFEYDVAPSEVASGPLPRRLRPDRIALARHVLRAAADPLVAASPKLALDVAVACNAVFEYGCALDRLRALLRERPGHRGAFWLASEITAQRRLGVLLFEGREYLDGFRALEAADGLLAAASARAAAAAVGASRELGRLHRALAEAHFAAGDGPGAAEHWRLARAIEPGFAPAELAYRLGWLLATCAEPACRSGEEAVALARFHGEQRGWRGVAVYDLLAVALAEAGRFEEAVAAGERALERAKPPPMRAALVARLEGYRAGRPWREARRTD